MSKIEKAVSFMEKIAKDDRHGYDQIYRWGEKGDYDCSALVITAFEKAGFPVKSKYGASYTGNMKQAFIKAGFINVIHKVNINTGAGLKRGDILLNENYHTAVFCGQNKIVQASINEKGTIRNGKPGDQTGYEIAISNYKNYRKGWNCILRFEEEKKKGKKYMIEKGDYNIKGKNYQIDRILEDGVQYTKTRDLIEILGLKIYWNNDTKKTTIK